MTLAEREIKIQGKTSERNDLKQNIKNRRKQLIFMGTALGILSAYCLAKGAISIQEKDKILSGALELVGGGCLLGAIATCGIYTGYENSKDKEEIKNINHIIEDFVYDKIADYQENMRKDREKTKELIEAFYKNYGIDIEVSDDVATMVEYREVLEKQKKLLEEYDLTKESCYKYTTANIEDQIENLEEVGISRNLRIGYNNQNN